MPTFDESIKADDFVKSVESPFSVIPAQAGIQFFQDIPRDWIPAFAGMTTFYKSIKTGKQYNVVV